MVYRKLTVDDRKKIVSQLLEGVKSGTIVSSYQRRGELISRQTIWRLLKHYRTHDTVSPLPRSVRPTKLTQEVMDVIESTMQT